MNGHLWCVWNSVSAGASYTSRSGSSPRAPSSPPPSTVPRPGAPLHAGASSPRSVFLINCLDPDTKLNTLSVPSEDCVLTEAFVNAKPKTVNPDSAFFRGFSCSRVKPRYAALPLSSSSPSGPGLPGSPHPPNPSPPSARLRGAAHTQTAGPTQPKSHKANSIHAPYEASGQRQRTPPGRVPSR